MLRPQKEPLGSGLALWQGDAALRLARRLGSARSEEGTARRGEGEERGWLACLASSQRLPNDTK